jgi:hypothetical protein
VALPGIWVLIAALLTVPSVGDAAAHRLLGAILDAWSWHPRSAWRWTCPWTPSGASSSMSRWAGLRRWSSCPDEPRHQPAVLVVPHAELEAATHAVYVLGHRLRSLSARTPSPVCPGVSVGTPEAERLRVGQLRHRVTAELGRHLPNDAQVLLPGDDDGLLRLGPLRGTGRQGLYRPLRGAPAVEG